VGGENPQGPANQVFSASIIDGQKLSDWEKNTELPVPLRKPALLGQHDQLYVLGGTPSRFYSTRISLTGRITEWQKHTIPVQESVEGGNLLKLGSRFLLIGGYNPTAGMKPVSEVYSWSLPESHLTPI
jgi:hypothetical protein